MADREKHLFVIKYFKRVPSIAEEDILANLTSMITASNKLSFDTVADGWVGVVMLPQQEAAPIEQVQSEANIFFHAIRALTARINGVSKEEADEKETPSRGRIIFPNTDAKWAHISFTKLIECFTFIGNPDAHLDTNDYCIVPPELGLMLKSNKIMDGILDRDKADPNKVGMLGGIGGHQGG